MNAFAEPELPPPSRTGFTAHSQGTLSQGARSPAQDRAIWAQSAAAQSGAAHSASAPSAWAKQADGLANRMTQNLKMNVRGLERSKRGEGRAMDLPQLRPGIYHNNPLKPVPKGSVTPGATFKLPTFQTGFQNSGGAAAGGPLPRNQDTLIPRVERPSPLPRSPGERMGKQV